MNKQNFFTLQVFQSLSPAKTKTTFVSLAQKIYAVSMQMHSKFTQRKLASHKKTSCGKVSRRTFVAIAKKNNLESEKKPSVVRERIATMGRHYAYQH